MGGSDGRTTNAAAVGIGAAEDVVGRVEGFPTKGAAEVGLRRNGLIIGRPGALEGVGRASPGRTVKLVPTLMGEVCPSIGGRLNV